MIDNRVHLGTPLVSTDTQNSLKKLEPAPHPHIKCCFDSKNSVRRTPISSVSHHMHSVCGIACMHQHIPTHTPKELDMFTMHASGWIYFCS